MRVRRMSITSGEKRMAPASATRNECGCAGSAAQSIPTMSGTMESRNIRSPFIARCTSFGLLIRSNSLDKCVSAAPEARVAAAERKDAVRSCTASTFRVARASEAEGRTQRERRQRGRGVLFASDRLLFVQWCALAPLYALLDNANSVRGIRLYV